jgi:hypothetical protein
MKPEQRRRPGRPPGGLGKHGEPEKIRDYPKLLITMRPSVKARLKAIAEHEERPAWKVVEDAIAHYAAQLPPKDHRVVDAATRRITI